MQEAISADKDNDTIGLYKPVHTVRSILAVLLASQLLQNLCDRAQ
jgi:hypothetical protein